MIDKKHKKWCNKKDGSLRKARFLPFARKGGQGNAKR